MKNTIKFTILLLLTAITFQSCQDNDDVDAPVNLEVQNFIWKGLNLYYLWQADVPNLSDTKFANQAAQNTFLKGYPVPEDLFNALRVGKTIDRFSWIVPDYLVLEQAFQGTTKNDGIEFGLSYKPGSTTEIFGWVRYIIPNSDASTKAIKRGDFFTAVNGTQLTLSNYQSLFINAENYTLNLADYSGTTIVTNGKTIAFTKKILNENPIAINKVIVSGTHKIGYLMYNGFFANYDSQLNDAFGSLKSQGITELVLDLRYNSGGSVLTATRLASMITGQFTGKVFAKQQWNAKVESYFSTNNPDALKNFFTDKMGNTAINSMDLTKIYILTSKSSASASELVINGLRPHINVVQIGDITTGKNVGSITVYDSPTFGAENRNPNHRYAMQPIVLKIVNSEGFGEYQDGLVPTHALKETFSNLGVLGETTEPLLNKAIGVITGVAKTTKQSSIKEFEFFKDSKAMNGQNQMHLDYVPKGVLKQLE